MINDASLSLYNSTLPVVMRRNRRKHIWGQRYFRVRTTREVRTKDAEKERNQVSTHGALQFRCVEWLRLEHCVHGIARVLPQSSYSQLTTVEFVGQTRVDNVNAILENCFRLSKTIFNSILFPGKPENMKKNFGRQKVTERASTVSAKPKSILNVTTLVLGGANKLTADESLLLLYLTDNYKFGNLSNLVLSKWQTGMEEVTSSATATNMPSIESSSSLTLFLLENQDNLKSLEITRAGIRLFPDEFKPSTPLVQLERFSFNMATAGFQKILNQQKRLVVLECFNERRLSPAAFASVFVAIDRCRHTIRDIKLAHRYDLLSAESISTNVPTLLQHDCNLYKACHYLRSLNLNLTDGFSHDDGTDNGKRVELVGTNGFPASIQSLIIRFDFICETEMDTFASRIVNLKRLKFLIFHGNPKYPYKLKLEWVTKLLQLPQIEMFEFHFCQPLDSVAAENLFTANPQLSKHLKMTAGSCTYWRGPSHKYKPA